MFCTDLDCMDYHPNDGRYHYEQRRVLPTDTPERSYAIHQTGPFPEFLCTSCGGFAHVAHEQDGFVVDYRCRECHMMLITAELNYLYPPKQVWWRTLPRPELVPVDFDRFLEQVWDGGTDDHFLDAFHVLHYTTEGL
jgi:hypothetical protein